MATAILGISGLAYKIEHVLEANEPFDRVFIGSSHLFRQVDRKYSIPRTTTVDIHSIWH
ncbi:MAG: hypothetical protein IPO90_07045 [Flavobacteriales bacterium]|nr:hypothetical protein [Flavobacteriales bacterium]